MPVQPHANGDGASKKRKRKKDDEPTQGAEPFIGPLPPDPKTGKPRSHITGSSTFRDEHTGRRFSNTWDIKDTGDELKTSIGGPDAEALKKFSVSTNHREVLKHHREVKRQAERAAYFRDRVLGATPIPKPSGKKSKPKSGGKKACPECDGTGLVWFGDYADVCPKCNGEKEV